MTPLFLRIATTTGVLALGAALAAQEPMPRGPFMMDDQFPARLVLRIVKGQPFSAQTVTEVTQTLADGNRIVQRSEGALYRDGEGRTRREHTLTGMGPLPFGPAMRGRQVITIDDVVAGKQYALDPQGKTVQETTRWIRRARPDGAPMPPPPDRIDLPARERTGGPRPVRESLGTKVIEGVEAAGTRTTMTIPAGEVGNEMPIEIVTERWVSNELQVPVLMRFSDPRMGERVHRLTGIVRGEPSPQLFVVPPDYKEAAPRERPMRQQDKRVP